MYMVELAGREGKPDTMHYIIIGNGVAGTTAALNIRKTDAAGDITVLTDESHPFSAG